MHYTNYQNRIRLTFVDDYFDEKWEENIIILCINHCNKKKFFKMIVPPSDPAISFAYNCVY